MRVAIHQPNLLPRVKILQKLSNADLWILLDDVQFNRRDYQNRAYIVPTSTSQRNHWLTLPIRRDRNREERILNQLRLAEPNPGLKVRDHLLGSFGSVESIRPILEASLTPSAFADEPGYLVTLCRRITETLLQMSGRLPNIVNASSLRAETKPKSEGIVQLLDLVGASSYLADSGARGYLDSESIERKGVEIIWQGWDARTCKQCVGGDVNAARNGSAINILARDPGLLFRELNEDYERPERRTKGNAGTSY